MPGELGDVTQNFPFYYDRLYDPGGNTFEERLPDVDDNIQKIVIEILGAPLGKEKLDTMRNLLGEKGFLHTNRGDESFKQEIVKCLKTMTSAMRVVRKYAGS